MKRNFMSRYMSGKETGAEAKKAEGADGAGKKGVEPQKKPARENAQEVQGKKKPPQAGGVEECAIYDDTDVCRTLGIRKRVIVRLRKESARGEIWGTVECHAGMTGKWVESQRKGATAGMDPVKSGDGIVTVSLERRFANAQMAGVKVVATGTSRVAWVHDTGKMTIGEQFDCKWFGKKLQYVESLNSEAY